MIEPDWPAPPRVRALVTTRDFGDLADEGVRRKLRGLLPAEPCWLKQVHGKRVVDLDRHAVGRFHHRHRSALPRDLKRLIEDLRK